MKKVSEALRTNEEFKALCKRCGEKKSVKYFNEKRGICSLCVSKEDSAINVELTAKRRLHEFERDMRECDYSLESLDI